MSDSAAPKRTAVGEIFGRYFLYAPIARGGMATVHIARLTGAEGFSRIVAAKRLHQDLTQDSDFLTMFLDEARIASKIHHPNVVPVLDVVQEGEEVILVQEYVHGVPLDRLLRAARTRSVAVPVEVTVAIAVGLLSGLHAAHETKDELGVPLEIVHRDVSPQNIMVSVDGAARLLDFGIAKAASSAHITREGIFKGKVSYIAPEQLRGEAPQRTADLFALGVVLWEMLMGRRLHHGLGGSELFAAVLNQTVPPLTKGLERGKASVTEERWKQLVALEPILERALAPAAQDRYQTAAEMLDAISRAARPATSVEVARWVTTLGKEYIDSRDKVIVAIEESWRAHPGPVPDTGSGPSSGPAPVDMVSGPRSVPTSHPFGPVVPSQMSPVLGSPILPLPMEADMISKRMRRMVWGLAAALLVAIAVLAGVLVAAMRPAGDTGKRAETTPTAEPTATVPLMTVPSPPPPAAATTPPTSTATGVAENTRPAAPPATWRPPPRPPVHYAPPPQQNLSTPAVAATPPAPKPDPCDPPFYFDGKKKVYKQGCL